MALNTKYKCGNNTKADEILFKTELLSVLSDKIVTKIDNIVLCILASKNTPNEINDMKEKHLFNHFKHYMIC